MVDWKRTSSWNAIAIAVTIITPPSTRCRDGPRGTRAISARPASANASSTTALPAAYARPTETVRPEAAPTETTAARIGPAHGAYTKPSAAPTSTPDQNPWPTFLGPKRASRDSGASSRAATAGIATARPNASSTTIAMSRVAESPSPTPSTTVARPTIVTVNVIASPSTIPTGQPPARGGRPPPAGRARAEQRGEDRQHAWAHGGARARDEGEYNEKGDAR